MADNAFKVLVLPRGEAADISQFGTELQKICDKVNAAKIKIQADPTAISNSIKTALSAVKFDVQFNAASIETSIKTALTGKTFDINVNPVVQQGGSGGGTGNGNGSGGSGNGGGGQPQQRRQQIGQRDTFANLVSSQVYLEGLKKKLTNAIYRGNDASVYQNQINAYAQNLALRKTQFATQNNISTTDLNTAIQQTERFTKAQIETAAASEKAKLAWDAQVVSAVDFGTQLEDAEKRINKLKLYETGSGVDDNGDPAKVNRLQQWSQAGLLKNLVKTEEIPGQGTSTNSALTKNRTGLLVDYEAQLKRVQQLTSEIKSPTFNSMPVEDQRKKVTELNTAYQEFSKTEQQVTQEMSDFQNKTGNYKGGFFDEFVEGVGKKFGWAMMAAAAREARQALSQLYTNVVQLDGALTQISIVTGTSGDALKSFANDAANVAKEVGSTTSSIISSTETYARLGYTLQDSLNLADVTAQYANVAGVDVESATSSLTSIMKSFNVAPTEMEGVVDKLVKVGQEYAISAGELGEAMQRGGAAMAAGGATLDETIALFTAGRMRARVA